MISHIFNNRIYRCDITNENTFVVPPGGKDWRFIKILSNIYVDLTGNEINAITANEVLATISYNSKYLTGGLCEYINATTVNITPCTCYTEDNGILQTTANKTLNITNIGVVNGLDSGTFTINNWYGVYLIGGIGKTTGTLASLATNSGIGVSATPTLPTGYTRYKHIGWIYAEGANTIKPFNCVGNGNVKTWEHRKFVTVASAIKPNATPTAIPLSTGIAGDSISVAIFIQWTNDGSPTNKIRIYSNQNVLWDCEYSNPSNVLGKFSSDVCSMVSNNDDTTNMYFTYSSLVTDNGAFIRIKGFDFEV